MAIEFNIREIFADTFGYQPPEDFTVPAAIPEEQVSSMGQPYYDTDLYGREMFMPVRLGGLFIPFAVVSIACKKTIVETALPERPGTVKELINTEDYSINIKGIAIRPDNNYPESDIIDLERLFRRDETLTLRSALTDIFLKGDYEHQVIVRSLRLPSVAGVQHAQPFELELTSDRVFQLELE